MLVEFRVKNFRSLKDEQVLSFVSSKADKTFASTHCMDTEHKPVPSLTRSALIYGANAAGKSNLMFALATMRNLVLGASVSGTRLSDHYTPFLLSRDSATDPTEFEVSVIIDNKRYQYGFAYDGVRVRREWLLVYEHARAQRWFERSADYSDKDDQWEAFSAYFSGPKETWKKATRRNALFLTTAVQLNSEQLAPLFNWFENGIILLTGGINLLPTLQRLESQSYKSRILDLLQAADIHVSDIRVEKKQGQQVELKLESEKPSEFRTSDVEIPEIEFCHQIEGEDPVWFDRRFESAGTQRALAYAGPLLDALENRKLLVVDELDGSLHPLLARFLVRLVHTPDIAGKGAQLWATTHDTSLLDTKLLRRDQIWFVEKSAEQATELYSLSDFKPRKNDLIERGYLLGRYGGIPFVRDLDLANSW